MNQYYNPKGFQPYTGAGQQGAQPMGGGQGFPQFPPASAGGQMPQQQMPQMPQMPPAGGAGPGMLPLEQSYIENILRLNKGKLATVFATFEGNSQWNAKEFKGIIEAAGRDHVILSDPQVGTRFLIPMVAVDYITFPEEIEYEYPYGAAPSLGTYPPR
ncbi:spore germination protein Q [Bacillus sp. SORGH_AS 510]|uniref:spore coat protein GerQ n=1 Tax=Bacillus sp. SORGH_AS_0510 TaxID=3041771 RepID=UPI002782A78A|nr:spore coat protein GerQ [Bacillus sp. SORGH_AS_0510]MDQ1143503.1 spore germination protein Q [Bacillus sp. SORGH_AS_0510]